MEAQVGVAAPIVAALVKGTGKENVVSELYGGAGGESAATDEVYTAIGNVRILSFDITPEPQYSSGVK